MNTSALAFSFPRQQHGAASVAIVLLLVFILSAAVMAVLRVSGSSVSDSSTNEAQVSALSLAESGLERAQATLTLAGYTSAACTALAGTTSNLGRGTFTYTAAVFNAGICTVTVTGKIGDSSRTIRAALSNAPAQGVAGNGATIPLRLTTGAANVAVITNLAYPAGANASIGTCTNPANCSDVLQVTGTGASRLSNRSVYESVAASGVYAITQTLENAGNPAPRNFVQVAAVFSPAIGAVGHVGAYTEIGNTTGTGGAGGSIRANWNCGGGTNGEGVAAGANTLVYGFSSLAAPANQLSAVSIGGRPLSPIRSLTGNQGDNLYSQLWVASNPAYISGTGTTSGAKVTGWAGTAKSIGEIKSNNTSVVCLRSYSTSSTVSSGMNMRGSGNCPLRSGTKTKSNIQTSGQALCDCNGGSWSSMMNKCTMGGMGGMGGEEEEGSGATYTGAIVLDQSQSPSSGSGTVIVDSDVFTVTSASKPFLEVGDKIYGTGVATGTTIKAFMGGSGGTGTYRLNSVQGFDETTITSNGTIISTSAGAIPTGGKPALNTLIAMTSGTGELSPGTTVITTPPTKSLQFSNSATKYRISNPTKTPLSDAQVCGGVCAFFDNDGNATPFALNNINAGTDWSSGFTCLTNVSAALGAGEVIDSQRRQWSEVVQ